jgi:hypothetical protein
LLLIYEIGYVSLNRLLLLEIGFILLLPVLLYLSWVKMAVDENFEETHDNPEIPDVLLYFSLSGLLRGSGLGLGASS